MTTCRVCLGPLTAVSDDPDPTHPSCAPSDPTRFEAATHGPRTYVGRMRAVWPSRCVCGSAIAEGDRQWLRDTKVGARWVCADCADPDRLSGPLSGATVVPRPRTRPERSGATERPETNAPRRAA